MSRIRAWLLFPPLLVLCACRPMSASAGGNNGADDTSGSDDEGGQPSNGADSGAQHDVDAASSGQAPAGKSGADTFSTQICSFEERCGLVDAGTSTCDTDYEAYFEESGANLWDTSGPPPLELYRADYVSALGGCIAKSSCGSLDTAEADCTASLVEADAGTPIIAPTSTLSAFCSAFSSSTCLAAQSGATDCTSSMMLFSDDTLLTATACLSESSCSDVSTCFADAFEQP